MSFLVLAVLLTYVVHCFCDTRNCTRDERCLLVNASICDNSKCLLVNKTDVDKTVNDGTKLYAYNINSAAYTGFCPLKRSYEQPGGCIGNPTIYITDEIYSGPGCNELSATVMSQRTPDPDPEVTGQMRLLTANADGYTIEDCFTYLEPGKAYVYRRCLVYPDLPAGKACAAIFARMVATENCTSPGLVEYVKNLNIDLPQTSVDCL